MDRDVRMGMCGWGCEDRDMRIARYLDFQSGAAPSSVNLCSEVPFLFCQFL